MASAMPVTKVVGKPGMPVVYETIGVAAPLSMRRSIPRRATGVTLSNGNLTATHTSAPITGGSGRRCSRKAARKVLLRGDGPGCHPAYLYAVSCLAQDVGYFCRVRRARRDLVCIERAPAGMRERSAPVLRQRSPASVVGIAVDLITAALSGYATRMPAIGTATAPLIRRRRGRHRTRPPSAAIYAVYVQLWPTTRPDAFYR